jgi:hypothetical protein
MVVAVVVVSVIVVVVAMVVTKCESRSFISLVYGFGNYDKAIL